MARAVLSTDPARPGRSRTVQKNGREGTSPACCTLTTREPPQRADIRRSRPRARPPALRDRTRQHHKDENKIVASPCHRSAQAQAPNVGAGVRRPAGRRMRRCGVGTPWTAGHTSCPLSCLNPAGLCALCHIAASVQEGIGWARTEARGSRQCLQQGQASPQSCVLLGGAAAPNR